MFLESDNNVLDNNEAKIDSIAAASKKSYFYG